MSQTVIGIFDSSSEAQNAVQQLVSNGISRSNIDISDRSTSGTTSDSYDTDRDDDSIGGFFRSLFGGDDHDANKYSQVARRSCTVTVHAQTSEEASRAAELLDDYGAVDVDERAQQYGATGSSNFSGGFNTGTAAGLTTGTAGAINTGTTTNRDNLDYNRTGNLTNDFDRDRTDNFTRDNDTSIPIIEENIQVGKRETETGGVRVRSRIVERPVEEHLRLREEHVNVERNPVNRPANEADLNAFREGTIELTEHAEVPVVNKEARVVEEISLNKEVTERDEVIRDTVRKTEVDVDNLASTDTNRRYDTDTDTTRRYDTDSNTDYNNSGTGSTRILDTDADRDRNKSV
jgi:stress response protein YsnF